MIAPLQSAVRRLSWFDLLRLPSSIALPRILAPTDPLRPLPSPCRSPASTQGPPACRVRFRLPFSRATLRREGETREGQRGKNLRPLWRGIPTQAQRRSLLLVGLPPVGLSSARIGGRAQPFLAPPWVVKMGKMPKISTRRARERKSNCGKTRCLTPALGFRGLALRFRWLFARRFSHFQHLADAGQKPRL